MDIQISISEEELAQKRFEVSTEYALSMSWAYLLVFSSWIFFDYLLVPHLWQSFALWRGIALLTIVLAVLWHSFVGIRALLLGYLLYFAVGLPLLPMLVAVPSQHLGVYLLQYTMAYLSLGALLIIPPLHAYTIAALSLGSHFLLLYSQQGFSLQSYGLQGGLLAMGSVLVGMLISTHRFGVQSKRLRTLAASERAKSQLYDINATLEAQKKEIEKKNKEIDAQNEALQEQNRYISTQNQELALAYKQITDSINYAKRIQKAILGDIQRITEQFHEAFIFYEPKDIVSGDFYWFARLSLLPDAQYPEGRHFKILVAADCTGHGVPGAFMTVMGYGLLNEIVNKRQIWMPHEILQELDQNVMANLNKQGTKTHDGMDITVLCIDEPQDLVYMAAAKNPLWYYRSGELLELPAQPFSIGNTLWEPEQKTFVTQQLKIRRNDVLYLFSDGFADQFGGHKGKKYLTKRFREFLLKNAHLPLPTQKYKLEQELRQWQGNYAQTDDITVIGLKF